jgi:hypothetical protein
LREFFSQAAEAALPKLKAIAPYAAVGGAVGGGLGYLESKADHEPTRQRIQELEAKPDRTAREALSLANSRRMLTLHEHAEAHPAAATAMGALMGATTGVTGGPPFLAALKSLKHDPPAVLDNIRDIRGK